MAQPSGRRDVERLVAKFCACLRDSVRLEPQRSTSVTSSSSCLCSGWVSTDSAGELPWLCVRFDDELTRQDAVPSDSRWRRVRELLEAVSILSAVACCRAFSLQRNPRFWRQFLEGECRVRSSVAAAFGEQCRGNNSMSTMPKFLLDFSFMDVTPDLLKLCRSFLTGWRRAKRCMRSSFVVAMTHLEAIAKQQRCSRAEKIEVGFLFNRCGLQRSPPQPSPDVKGAAAVTGKTSTAQGSALQQLQELIGDIAAHATSIERHQTSAEQQQRYKRNSKVLDVEPTAWGCFFCQVSVLEVSANELVKEDFARIAHLVSDPNGRLRELVLNKIISSSSKHEYASGFGTLMSACFSVTPDSSHSTESEVEDAITDESKVSALCRQQHQHNLWRFGFDWNALNLNRLSSLFSAIHASSRTERSVWDLSLVGSFRRFNGDPTLPWAWLAFGVFHATSQSRIQSLDLSTNTLCHDDVNAMKRVLTMENYQKELLASDEVLYSEQSRVVTNAQLYSVARLKKQARLWPTSRAGGKALLHLNDESVWFEVFQHDTRWTCVLVPGYGVLWTRTKMVLKIEKRERQIHFEPHLRLQLKKLMLNSMVVKKSERINHLLRELLPLVGGSLLHLELGSNPLSNIALAAIMSSCPHLKYLDISACDLQTIGAILDSYERSECRIATLVMAENHVREKEVQRLCSLLRDPEMDANSAAANLRYLDLDQNLIGRQGLLAIGKMLASNRVLQTVILSKSEDPDGQLRGRFAIHEDEFLDVRSLNVQQRLAMLSAAREVPAIAAIDVPVLQTVFAFAGTHVHRRIVWK